MTSKEGTANIIRQIICLLERIEDYQYEKPLPIFDGTSLGKHFRHILDFYLCLVKGMETSIVDYTCRERNPKMETSAAAAAKAFNKINLKLEETSESMLLQVRTDFGDVLLENRKLVPSSVGRELMFACDHAIHHLAMIKIGLKNEFPEIHCEEMLGVAPATLKFEQKNKINT